MNNSHPSKLWLWYLNIFSQYSHYSMSLGTRVGTTGPLVAFSLSIKARTTLAHSSCWTIMFVSDIAYFTAAMHGGLEHWPWLVGQSPEQLKTLHSTLISRSILSRKCVYMHSCSTYIQQLSAKTWLIIDIDIQLCLWKKKKTAATIDLMSM